VGETQGVSLPATATSTRCFIKSWEIFPACACKTQLPLLKSGINDTRKGISDTFFNRRSVFLATFCMGGIFWGTLILCLTLGLRGGGNVGGTTSVQMKPFWPPYIEDHENSAEWSYSYDSQNGPESWPLILDTKTGKTPYADCSGRAQSPVDLPSFSDYASALSSEKVGSTMKYSNAPSWQIAPRSGGHPGFHVLFDDQFAPSVAFGNVTLNGSLYELDHFHFHAPSEHTVEGYRFPLEAHFVHMSTTGGGYAVFSILFNHSEFHNAALDTFWLEIFHSKKGLFPISISALWEKTTKVFQSYTGSLTSPPCTEGVLWNVALSSVGVNQVQDLVFTYALNGIKNYRKTQPLNGRITSQKQML